MDIVTTLLKQSNTKKLKDFLNLKQNENLDLNTTVEQLDHMSPLQYAAFKGNVEILELILQHPAINVDSTDEEGNTALHIAVAVSQLQSVKCLLEAKADTLIPNYSGKLAKEYAEDEEIRGLIESFYNSLDGPKPANEFQSYLEQIMSELPAERDDVAKFLIGIIEESQNFQLKCKETIYLLIEEKQMALHKYRLLENAAGIKDGTTGETFLDQLAYLQDENEKQNATISFLKNQTRGLKQQIADVEENHREAITALVAEHTDELQLILKRNEEMENDFLEYRQRVVDELEELTRLKNENESLKNKLQQKSGQGSVVEQAISNKEDKLLQSLQNQNEAFDQKMKDIAAKKLVLVEKLKTYERMKNVQLGEKTFNESSTLSSVKDTSIVKYYDILRNEEIEDEESGDIVLIHGEDGSTKIKAGTPEKLLQRFVKHLPTDNQYIFAFLLSYRLFTDKMTVFNMLKDQYTKESEGGSELIAASIHLHICNILKSWIVNIWYDFENDEAFLESLKTFVEVIKQENQALASIVYVPLNQKLTKTDKRAETKRAIPPKPILPKYLQKKYADGATGISKLPVKADLDFKIKFMDLDPLELARQITLIEYNLFVSIKPTEFLDLAWMKEDKEKRSPNICAMTKWSNHMVYWAITEMVSVKDSIKARAAVFERFITLAQHLEKLNNFNGVKEILAAFNSASVYRLKKTKEAMGAKALKLLDDLMKMTSSELNFKNLRTKVHASEPPLIPFPGVYQGDLVFLDTCNKSKIENGLINFMKHQKFSSYIQELLSFQQYQYNLDQIDEIQEFLQTYVPMNDDEAYNNSLQCEQRAN